MSESESDELAGVGAVGEAAGTTRAGGVDPAVSEAADPTTAPGRLAQLAQQRDVAVRAAVASNPNAPAEVLVGLMGEVGGEAVVNNPALGLLLLVDPLFLRRLSLEARRWLARQRLPRPLCELLLLEGPMVREELARHQPLDDALARQLLGALAPQDGPSGGRWPSGARLLQEALADALAANPTAPPWAVLEAARAVGLRRTPVHDEVTLDHVFEAMAASDDPLVRALAAGDPRADSGLIERLAGDDSNLVRRAVAANPEVSETLFERLVVDASAQVRQALGRHPRAPRWVLRKLARDPSQYVHDRPRQRLRKNAVTW